MFLQLKRICGRRIHTVVLSILFLVCSVFSQQKASPSSEAPAAQHGTPEDWSALSLAGSQLRAEKPVFGAKDDKPLFSRELIQVKWRLGDPIDLYIIKPKGVARPPVVLYLYSYPSETDRFRDDDYCARLTRNGVAAIGFVSALTGHRYAMRPMKEWFVSELQESLGKSIHDVQMILNFLSDRDDLDMTRVGMLGTGSGGTIAILSAYIDPRIKTIDVLDPWGDWPTWMAKSSIIPDQERSNYVKPEFLKKVDTLEPLRYLPQMKSTKIRIQQVMDDLETPRESREKLDAAAPANATIVQYEDSAKFFRAVAGGRLFDWVKDQVVMQKPPEADVAASSTAQPAEPGHNN